MPLFFDGEADIALLLGLAHMAAAALGSRPGLFPLCRQIFMTSLALCVVDSFEALLPNIIYLVARNALLRESPLFFIPCVVTLGAILDCRYVGLVR